MGRGIILVLDAFSVGAKKMRYARGLHPPGGAIDPPFAYTTEGLQTTNIFLEYTLGSDRERTLVCNANKRTLQ